MNYQTDAQNALALIDKTNPGPGAYTDSNIQAVARTRAMLHQIASGHLVLSPAVKEDATGSSPEKVE